jgi:two-component sensor histidine kinase
LAIISALLVLQSDITNEYAAKEALQKSQSRINSIATVHEMLYKTGDFSGIDSNTCIKTLFDRISELNEPDDRLTSHLEIADVKMIIMHGAPFGLLLNELITNSFMHAFKGKSECLIQTKIEQIENQVIFQFLDKGVGLTSEEFESGTSDSGLGLTLIKL